MPNLLGSRIAGGNTAYERSKSDFYPTPPEVTYALLDFLKLPESKTVIWEPACGEGHMVNQIKKMGYDVFGTDINTGTDFLSCDRMIKIRGVSDDLVEIYGSCYREDEIGCWEKNVRIRFLDGTIIRVGYPMSDPNYGVGNWC